MSRTEREKMLAGELYRPGDAELQAEMAAAKVWMSEYNAAMAASTADRRTLLRKRLGHIGKGVVVRPPFFCDYGFNISIGDEAFLNFNCIILDVAPVTIGAGAQIGPAVQILAADHPRDHEQRRSGLELGRPVRIGENAWIGGGAIILPGVTVGDDAIVGAGAVVTRDVAPATTVIGIPARRIPD
jgi:maltose O-acetyltransferase